MGVCNPTLPQVTVYHLNVSVQVQPLKHMCHTCGSVYLWSGFEEGIFRCTARVAITYEVMIQFEKHIQVHHGWLQMFCIVANNLSWYARLVRHNDYELLLEGFAGKFPED